MPNFNSIIGQQQPIRFLTILLHKGIIPNALLFTGAEGIGKRSAAVAFAMAANCRKSEKDDQKRFLKLSDKNFHQKVFPTESCGNCRSCRKFNSGSYPDLILINPQGQMTKIAQIRELRKTLAMKPFEARLRVVIIAEAHTLNPEASNALLKVLEEPPEQTIFILVTPRAYDLLPTILSRCQLIRFNPIPVKLLADALVRDYQTAEKEAEVIAAMAEGSFSKVKALKNGKWILLRNWIIEEIKVLDSSPVVVILALAEKLAKNKEKELARNILEMLKSWFRDLVIAEYSPEKIINKDIAEQIVNFSPRYSENLLLKRLSSIEHAQKEIETNANLRLVLENLFLDLAEKSRNT